LSHELPKDKCRRREIGEFSERLAERHELSRTES
jgi:hypothetical protein